jgi:hypothetical protein
MPFVQSFAIEAVSYDEVAKLLRTKFRGDGRVVIYENVPQDVYDVLLFAESLGTYFREHIEGNYPERVIAKGKSH